jgi:hypothetical protein
MLRTFADIPDEVRRRIDAGERVVVIVIDAFGLVFLRRHNARLRSRSRRQP